MLIAVQLLLIIACCLFLFAGYEDKTLDPFGDHLIKNAGKLILLDRKCLSSKMTTSFTFYSLRCLLHFRPASKINRYWQSHSDLHSNDSHD